MVKIQGVGYFVNDKISKKINLENEVSDLIYSNSKIKNKYSMTISFKINDLYLSELKHMAKFNDVSPSIFCKNLIIAFIEKQRNKKSS
ncbi:MAG: hypothetical protein LBF00_03025 [Mycoplasmataceae bacterium]|jgi:hypothetical protein|nr:hypothetical protein [Mycoplasmataceae bacterium]